MPWGLVAGGIIGAVGSEAAASTQAGAAKNAQNIAQSQFQTIENQEVPYENAGSGALTQLQYGLGFGSNDPSLAGGSGMGYGSLTQPFTMQNFQQLSPAYQFQQQQGMQGVLNGDAAGTGALSGSAQKDLISYNQGLANTSFNNAFNQYQTQQSNIFTRLSDIANLGQSAATNTAQTGAKLAGTAADAATNIGTAQGGGIAGAASNLSGSLSALPWLSANQQSYNPNTYDGGIGANSYQNDAELQNAINANRGGW